ncbi:MAG: hypothetical protein RMK29_07130 [Myxococcales bacterium]|nr:hypothetical protein [Myxococcota bacterium]MDW8281467.1 hypothetical protein [Myxococcales bacterium]
MPARARLVLLYGVLLVPLTGLASANTAPLAPSAGSGSSLVWNARPAEPQDIVALVRWRNPEGTVAVVQALVPMLQVRAAVLSALGPAGAALALGAPVDLLVALGPGGGSQPTPPMWAVAFGVSSMEAARKLVQEQLQGQWSELHKGVWAARFQAGGSQEVHCLLGPAPAASPLRVACGFEPRDVNALGPYLIRTLPQQNLGDSDLHVEIRVQPFYRVYAEPFRDALRLLATAALPKLQLGHPGFDRLMGDAVQGVVREIEALVADADRTVLDLSLSRGGIDLRSLSRLRGRTSWLASVSRAMAHSALPVPELLFRLPRDCWTAQFVAPVVMSAQVLAPIQTTLVDLLGAFLEHHGLPAGERKQLQDLLRVSRTPQWPTVWCTGPADLPPTALSSSRGSNQWMGQYMLGVLPGSPEPLRDWLQELVAAYNRPPVQALVRRTLGRYLGPGGLRPLPPQKQLPQGSYGLQLTLRLLGPQGSKGRKAQLVPITTYLVLVPDDKQTWFAMGGHLPTLLRRLRGQLQIVEANTLAHRQGLEALRHGTHLYGAYWTVAGAIGSIARLSPQGGGELAQVAARLLSQAPHRGETPVVCLSDVATRGELVETSTTIRMPWSALEDMRSLILGLRGTDFWP